MGVCVPAGWNEVSTEQLRERGIPQEVVVVFQSEQLVSGNIPTVLVTKEILTRDFDASTYSESNVVSVASLPAFEQVDKQELKIDGKKVHLHTFIAQPVTEEPKKRFYQLSSVSRGVGYTITAVLPVSTDKAVERQALTMLRSLTFEQSIKKEEK